MMIEVRGLEKTFAEAADMPREGNRPVLQGIDLSVSTGELVAIVGASGSGKSTLLQILGGLDVAYKGEVKVAGTSLPGLGDAALSRFRNAQVGFVFQSFHLVPQLSARENVRLPAFFSADANLGADSEARAEAVLARVGLASKAGRLPAQLSGGERQRVAIARALYAKPPLLLCDEPTGNLDARTGAEVIALFESLHAEGLTLLIVTHEERMSAAAGRVLRLEEGRLAG